MSGAERAQNINHIYFDFDFISVNISFKAQFVPERFKVKLLEERKGIM